LSRVSLVDTEEPKKRKRMTANMRDVAVANAKLTMLKTTKQLSRKT